MPGRADGPAGDGRTRQAMRMSTMGLRRGGGRGALLLALLAAGGCAGLRPGPGRVRDDIVSIVQFNEAQPWLYDVEGRVNGVRSRVYFVSSQTERGTWVPGTIRVELYRLARRPDGTFARERVHEWTFDAERAAGMRVREPSAMGQSYGLLLLWPPELNLMGRQIQMVYSYERKDGHVVTRRGNTLLVPTPVGAFTDPWSGPGTAPQTRPAARPPAGATPPAPSRPAGAGPG